MKDRALMAFSHLWGGSGRSATIPSALIEGVGLVSGRALRPHPWFGSIRGQFFTVSGSLLVTNCG